ncbi:MAG TPA: hypothetical protein VGM82_01525 [Gemmatimonadaceae bacterium]|jgi:hypothetical protein
MPISAHLVQLRLRLEATGMVVVEEPDYLTIRLPFLCSVRVYFDGERLRFDSYFGILARVKSTALKMGGMTLLAIAAPRYGLAYAGVVALLALVAGIYDSIRWQITEHAITRVSMINALAATIDSAGQPLLGYGSGPIAGTTRNSISTADDRVAVRERRDD